MKSCLYENAIKRVADHITSDENKAHLHQGERVSEVQAMSVYDASIVLAVIFNRLPDEVEKDVNLCIDQG